ncbi:DEAD/DEAH box helicase [Natrialbaceae archaeon A-CW1-1]
MESYLDSVTKSFLEDSHRLSQLSVCPSMVDSDDSWSLEEAIPVGEIINAFRVQKTLVQPGGQVFIPLHAEDSAELTGDYLIYRVESDEDLLDDDSDPHELHFLNADTDRDEFREVGEAGSTYLAYRMRFWYSRYDPPETPSYLSAEHFDDRPPQPPRELSAVDPLSDEEYESFIDTTEQVMADQLKVELQSSWDSSRKMSIERLQHGQDGDGIGSTGYSRLAEGKISVSAPGSGVHRNQVEATYGIHKGNIVAIAAGNDSSSPVVPGVVTRVGLCDFQVELDWAATAKTSQAKEELWSADRVSVAIIDRNIAFVRERSAFSDMAVSTGGKRLLGGESPLSFDSPLSVSLNSGLELNSYQRRAAINALRARDAYCIHGPPGTGKTRTLTAIIQSAVESGERVLICAHSNQAVDNLIAGESSLGDPDNESLHGIIQKEGYRLARIGRRDQITSRVVTTHYADEEIDQAKIVATTTNSADRLEHERFNLIVVDEATQASIPATAVPFKFGPKLVLAGDHKQLPPYYSGENVSDEAFYPSLFEHLLNRFGDDAKTTLRRQYRMHESIANFSNMEFYDGLLFHGEANKSATISQSEPLVGINIDSIESDRGDSRANIGEAEVVIAQVQKALNAGVDASDIGVITPYTGQKNIVEEKLEVEFGSGRANNIKVQTIDSFQGGQREVIIVTFTVSNDGGNSGFLAFPNEGPRRLNVALTRAKKRLVLIGNWETLSSFAKHRDAETSCADLYSRLYEYIEEHGKIVG